MRGRIENITDANWSDFRDSAAAVLVLAQHGCPHCQQWSAELERFLDEDEVWGHVRFGKILLDGDDVSGFKEDNDDWLAMVPGVPFNVLYRDGQPLTSMPGAGIDRLTRRLDRRFADTSRET
jgi:hypothetical protein